MIITQLMGGLGNQMFQYAVGRRLAHRWGTPLKLDTSFYATQSLRSYGLGYFNIEEHFAMPAEVARMQGRYPYRMQRVIHRFVERHKPYYRRRFITEQSTLFDANILQAPRDTCLRGYWQTDRYFVDIADLLQREFTLRYPLSDCCQRLQNRIAAVNAVCVHVRRGDYAMNPGIHALCGLDYYTHAIALLLTKIHDAQLFVFTDDPAWVKAHLRFPLHTTVIEPQSLPCDYEDLHLMSCCKHFIIANSTFSWWGAWLATNLNKVVIAPARWFVSEAHDTRDLLPDAWYMI